MEQADVGYPGDGYVVRSGAGIEVRRRCGRDQRLASSFSASALGYCDLPAFRQAVGLKKDLRPVATMREWLGTLATALLAGETVDHEGAAITSRGFTLGSPPPKVPVVLGALGPNMLTLAGEASGRRIPQLVYAAAGSRQPRNCGEGCASGLGVTQVSSP